MLYTISIAVHNRLDLTKQCIDSIFAFSHDFEVIIVDNASSDGTAEYLDQLKAEHSNVVVFRNQDNAGFIPAHNNAICFAQGTYFIVLNNDVVVCPEWLEKMREQFIADPKLAICGINHKGFCQTLNARGVGTTGSKLDYIEGSCLMMPTYLARQFGPFDEAYQFGWCEDSDLSLRVRERGYNITTVSIPMSHLGGGTERGGVTTPVDFEGIKIRNHEILRNRWGFYLQKGTFQKRVLVKRMTAHGDVLLTTPVIRAIKERYAHAEITIQTQRTEIYARNPHVVKVVTDTTERFDEVYDLDMAYENRPNMHIIQAYSEVSDLRIDNWIPEIFPTSEDRAFAKQVMPNKGWAVIHPGQLAWPIRNWTTTGFDIVAQTLRKRGMRVVLVGDGATPEITCDLDLRRKTNVHQLASVIERADLFVGLDSLPMHLAQTALCPTVGLFGCIDPKYRLLPFPFIKGVVAEQIGCVGCHHYQALPRINSNCLRNRLYCMESITVSMVMSAIDKVLEEIKMFGETSKIRERVLPFCEGNGIDIGCGRDKLKPDALGVDYRQAAEVDIECDASRQLPFANGQFDYVYSSHCLEDIVDTEVALREWLRVLKSGGNIVLYLPHKDHYHGVNLDHKHEFVNADIEAFLVRLGCEILVSDIDVGDDRYSMLIVARKQ